MCIIYPPEIVRICIDCYSDVYFCVMLTCMRSTPFFGVLAPPGLSCERELPPIC